MRDVRTGSWASLAVIAAFSGALTASQSSSNSVQNLEATQLEVGKPIERELRGGQQHVYELVLKSGDYASLTVDQRGIDIMVRVLGADGKSTADFDSESRPVGQEQVGLVAESATTVRVAVRARYSRDPAARYEIRLNEIRPASDRERSLYDAHRIGMEAASLRSAGKYDEALARATHALTLAEAALGPNDAYVGSLLEMLAQLQRTKGEPAKAEQTFQRAIAIDEAALGREHPQTAAALAGLGELYNAADDYARAEPLLQEALAIIQRTLGREHPRVVVCLMDLSLVHQNRQDMDRALSELQRALLLAENVYEADDFALIAIVNNLGNLYVSLKDYDRAEPLVRRALEAIEKTSGRDHIRIANPLLNLGIISRERKQFDRALEFLWRAESVREKALGSQHPQTAAILISIGNVYHAEGDYVKALDTYQRALGVLESAAGPYHSLTMMTLNNAARTYAAQGDVAHALEYQARVDHILEKSIDLNLAIGSEREKLAYLDSTVERTGRTVSLHVRQAPSDRAATDLAALAILQRKGRVQDAMSGSLRALRQRLNVGDQRLLDRLGATTAELATLALNGPGRTAPADYQTRLRSLGEQQEALEAEISTRSAEFRAHAQPVTLQAVEAAIPKEAVLIEFAVYRPFNPKAPTDAEAHEDTRYVAYVIRQHGDVRWTELGPTRDVDDAIAAFRQALRDPKRADVKHLARAVDAKVMQPIRPLLDGATQLLVAPDGELNLIPFEALVDDRDRYLVERYSIDYLTTGRDLLRLQVPRTSRSEPVVIANPAFGEPEPAQTAGHATLKLASAKPARRSITTADDLSRVYFAPLPGTSEEARAIKSLFPDATLLTGTRATKATLEHLDAPRILHIATHGFFLEDAGRAIQNPLLRSGVALTGANLSKSATDDGILTALEASNLSLWGTKLVTLSACDTGVGAVKNGEGVYGLRRSFLLAGAETLVMSLWPVSDYVTREMMTAYYSGLKDRLGRGEALRQAQLAMLTRKDRQHPFYWASFIHSGEWANLDGQRLSPP